MIKADLKEIRRTLNMSIGRVAVMLKVKIKTLEYYEKSGYIEDDIYDELQNRIVHMRKRLEDKTGTFEDNKLTIPHTLLNPM